MSSLNNYTPAVAVSDQGLAELEKTEAFRQYAYPDVRSPMFKAFPSRRWGFAPAREVLKDAPARVASLDPSPWTVGYGETTAAGALVDIDSTRTKEEAKAGLRWRIKRYEALVRKSLTVPATQGQFDALVSIAWNVETAVSKTSSIIKAHNQRRWADAAKAFGLYDKVRNRATGKLEKDPAIAARRMREGAAYLAGSPKDDQVEEVEYDSGFQDLGEVSTTVEPERPLSESEINKASVLGGTSVAVAAASEAADTLKTVNTTLGSIASWLPAVFLVTAGICFAYIMWQRHKQRKEGWA